MNEQIIFFTYWQEHWQALPPDRQQRWQIAVGVYLLLTIGGLFLAREYVPFVQTLDDGSQWIAAATIGPFGVLITLLQETGLLIPSNHNDTGFWAIWSLFNCVPIILGTALGFRPVPENMLHKRATDEHRGQQVILTEAEVSERIPIEIGIAVATVAGKKKGETITVGLDYRHHEGHLLITGPTRAGKGLHLTEVLLRWPGAAAVVDPKGEQYKITAGWSQEMLHPIYHVPGHAVRLVDYFDLTDPDAIRELHDQLLRPDEDLQRIFADKSLPLFRAVGAYARNQHLDAIRVLLDAAECPLPDVLRALDGDSDARPFVRQFTNGTPPDKLSGNDRFFSSAVGTLTTRLFPYQKHVDAICPVRPHNCLPADWVAQRARLFLTYSLSDLRGAGGVISAILAGLMRHHMAHGRGARLLIAIDELAAVRLRNLDTFLATVGGYGITLLLYSQSTGQLSGIYGRAGMDAILSNCAHQVWYPPHDFQTAQHISAQFGTALRPQKTISSGSRQIRAENGQTRTVPQTTVSTTLLVKEAYSPSEIQALPQENVIVFSNQGQLLRFIGRRLDRREIYNQLPGPPPVPRPQAGKREYTRWSSPPGQEATAGTAGDPPGPATRSNGRQHPTSASDDKEETNPTSNETVPGSKRPLNPDSTEETIFKKQDVL